MIKNVIYNQTETTFTPHKNMTYSLYPEIENYAENYLKVDDLHEIYYEISGNPSGKPVVFLHGGPGSGCNPKQRRFFDPAHYQIILIDQRGCGRSRPLGEIQQNSLHELIADIDAVRTSLGIEKWLVFGGSWGSTLALAYAIHYPHRVTGLILRGIFLSRSSELDWFLHEVRQFFPEAWQQLRDYPPIKNQQNLLQAYQTLIFSDDKKISIPAAIHWNAFEGSLMRLLPPPPETTHSENEINEEVELARARIQIHYIQQLCFVGQRNLLAEAREKLAHIPTHIIQGRYDMVCPPVTAWELSQAMPHAEFIMIPDAGHSASEIGTTSALIAATEKYKSL